MVDDYRGKITMSKVFTICCGRCDREENLEMDNRTEAEEAFKSDGWYKSGRQGWVCVDCRDMLGLD